MHNLQFTFRYTYETKTETEAQDLLAIQKLIAKVPVFYSTTKALAYLCSLYHKLTTPISTINQWPNA